MSTPSDPTASPDPTPMSENPPVCFKGCKRGATLQRSRLSADSGAGSQQRPGVLPRRARARADLADCFRRRSAPGGLCDRDRHSDGLELETNLSVASADAAATRFVNAGRVLLVPPFDISIGRCAVVQDPWGNRLVVLDHRNGRLLTDASGWLRAGPDGLPATQLRRNVSKDRTDIVP